MEYAGFIIILILLWIRPEYMFLLFYVFANYLLVFLISDLWRLTWADAPAYAMYVALNIAITLVIGALVVALFKWLKTRKTGRDKELDREMERIRAELAERGGASNLANGQRRESATSRRIGRLGANGQFRARRSPVKFAAHGWPEADIHALR